MPSAAGNSLAKSAATQAAKTVASSAVTVVAWKTAALATAAVLGLGGGGYYFNRDLKARTQLVAYGRFAEGAFLEARNLPFKYLQL